MTLMQRLTDQLVIDEGEVLKMYKDSLGIETIGVGHNLRDKPITQRASRVILEDDILQVFDGLDAKLPWWKTLDEDRQYVIGNMAFNMGIDGLLTFRNTLEAVKDGRYQDAADGMAASMWAKQVGERATRLINIMRGS